MDGLKHGFVFWHIGRTKSFEHFVPVKILASVWGFAKAVGVVWQSIKLGARFLDETSASKLALSPIVEGSFLLQ